ncbi:hypothetical protein D3C72_2047430 [compost metagenome]
MASIIHDSGRSVCIMLMPPILQAAIRSTPTGGVLAPIAMLIDSRMPKWTGSML